jgi:hypothetical protein
MFEANTRCPSARTPGEIEAVGRRRVVAEGRQRSEEYRLGGEITSKVIEEFGRLSKAPGRNLAFMSGTYRPTKLGRCRVHAVAPSSLARGRAS